LNRSDWSIDMTDAESLRQAVQSRAPLSTWLGVVLLLVLFGVIVLAVVGPSPRGDDYEQKRAKSRLEKLKTLRESDAKELTSYGWVDKNKQVVRLPVERAMELTVAELRKKKPAPAYPIATPAAAAPAATAAPSPARGAPAQASATPKAISIEGPQSEKRAQPAAAANPPGAQPATQQGASVTPAASPRSSVAVAPVSPSPPASPSPAGSPLPVAGKTPP
jgi:hypothetical protein